MAQVFHASCRVGTAIVGCQVNVIYIYHSAYFVFSFSHFFRLIGATISNPLKRIQRLKMATFSSAIKCRNSSKNYLFHKLQNTLISSDIMYTFRHHKCLFWLYRVRNNSNFLQKSEYFRIINGLSMRIKKGPKSIDMI